jgi:hypothetical protein
VISRELASYKIRFHDRHVRAVPVFDLDGAPFHAPGIDLRGEDAIEVIRAAEPVLKWLDMREPGVRVRSISFDVKQSRVLVSLEPYSDVIADQRPRALRFDPPNSNDLRDAARAAELLIENGCVRALERRRQLVVRR